MPPSASAGVNANYDADYAQALMEDLDNAPGLFRRAASSLLLLGLGVFILASALTYSPFDTTGDTAGIGVIQNALGKSGAGFANFLMQFMGWGSIIAGLLCLITGVKGVFWPKKSRPAQRWSYFALALGTIIFGAATLSGFPIPQSWPMATGLGGWFGDGIFPVTQRRV